MSVSVGTEYTTTAGMNSNASATQLEKTLDKDLSAATKDEMLKACKEFEAYFTEQIFKAMQKMVPKNEEEEDGANSQLVDYFKEQLTSEYAAMSAKGRGLGLAEKLYEQMKRNYGIE